MKTLLLTLKGGFSSWGSFSVGNDRGIERIPTGSAILGLAGACIGLDINDHANIKSWYSSFWVSTCSAFEYGPNSLGQYCYPMLTVDYQTAKGRFGMTGQEKKIESHRCYITDGLDVAAILPRHAEAEEWLDLLVYAFEQPTFTPYLGRMSNPFTVPPRSFGERLEQVDTLSELGEKLCQRLIAYDVGGMPPARCLLRFPADLPLKIGDITDDWLKVGKSQTPDQRSGGLRTFSQRNVVDYMRELQSQAG